MAHPVMWFAFYENLFGWRFDVRPQIGYGVATTGGSSSRLMA